MVSNFAGLLCKLAKNLLDRVDAGRTVRNLAGRRAGERKKLFRTIGTHNFRQCSTTLPRRKLEGIVSVPIFRKRAFYLQIRVWPLSQKRKT